MNGWKFTIAAIIAAWGVLLMPSIRSRAYADAWVDGTPYLYEEAQYLAQMLGGANEAMLAPSAVDTPKAAAYKVGDKQSFYATNMRNKLQYTLDASLRAVSDKAYIFVENGRSVSSSDTKSLLAAFDGIYDSITERFGSPPDSIDSDPRIYLLLMDVIDSTRADGARTLGYFSPIDQYRNAQISRWTNMRSNEVEILYIDYISTSLEAGGAERVAAHEFTHLVQWARDPSEAVWINEGIAVYAESLLGYKVKDRVADFEKNPNTSLLDWSGSLADYATSYLFFTYMSERFGETVIATIVRSGSHDTKGIERSLAMQGDFISFHKIFSDWVIANYLDDPDLKDGIYGYSTLDIHLEPSVIEAQYPIACRESEVESWTAWYVEFKKGESGDLSLSICDDGSDISDIVDQIIEIGDETRVSPLRPSGAQAGSAVVSQENSKNILVITSQPDPPELEKAASSYTYSAEIQATVISVDPISNRKTTTWGAIKQPATHP